MKRLALVIIPYFGTLPEWMDLFLLSCKYNAQIDWLIISDSQIKTRITPPSNVQILHCSFGDYSDRFALTFGFSYRLPNPYKLCDLKPMYGHVHKMELRHYQYWGFGDLDVIYGDLSVLFDSKWDVISSCEEHFSGHLCFFRNNARFLNGYKHIPKWKELISDPVPHGIDEHAFFRVYCKRFERLGKTWGVICRRIWNTVMRLRLKEEYTTPLIDRIWRDGTIGDNQPIHWKWKSGRIISLRENKESPYLHFMNFKSDRWHPTKNCVWKLLDGLVTFEVSDTTAEFFIGPRGFTDFDQT